MFKIEADLHVHTVHSGHAYSTLDEVARGASEKGINLIAITDHGPNIPGGPHEYYFSNIVILPEYLHGVRVLKGVEANILDEGKLDLSEKILKSLDFVAAGFHYDTGHNLGNEDDNTRAMIKAMENPYVNMITHPDSLFFPVDLEEIVKAARRNNVILELNASSFDKRKNFQRGNLNYTLKLCRLAKRYNVLLSLNSDAHFYQQVGDISSLEPVLKKADLSYQNIINTSISRVLSFLGNSKKVSAVSI